jgi:hypothetical protein
MALVVEDGTGLSNSNSYTTKAEADTYFSTHLYTSETWDEYTDTQKENALIAASLFLDQTYDWAGTKAVEDSAMRWPRSGVYDLDDVEIDDNVIPANLKKAVAELASELLVSDRLAAADSTGITELKVDVIELKFDKNDVKPVLTARVHTFLRGLGTSAMGSRVVKVFRS